jgi:hypothetical protein
MANSLGSEMDVSCLRIDLIGSTPSFLYALCKNTGCEISLSSTLRDYLQKQRVNGIKGYILVVSMTLTVGDCLLLQEKLSSTDSPVEVSFLVNDDPEILKEGISKIKAQAPKPVQGRAEACVDPEFGRFPMPSVQQSIGFGNGLLGALFLLGHSDGSCHTINNIAICTQASTARSMSSIETLPCYCTSECRFINRSPKSLRVDASSIHSSIIVDLTCTGFGIESTNPLTRFSFGKAFFANTSTEALITSLTATAFSLDDLCLAIYLARSGYQVSKVVRILNRFISIRGVAATSLIALGDPRTRLQSSVTHESDNRNNTISDTQALDYWKYYDQDSSNILLYNNAYYAMRSPNGLVYYTSTRAAKPLFTTVSTKSAQALLSFETLISGLSFAEIDLASLKKRANECDSKALIKYVDIAETRRKSLLLFCLEHNSKLIKPYHSYNIDTIHSAASRAIELSQNFQDAVFDTIQESILAKVDIIAGSHGFSTSSQLNAAEKCGYCSANTILSIHEMVGTSFKRFSSVCPQCGPLYLGSRAAKYIEIDLDQSWLNVKISISHSIPIELPVLAIVWCKYWNEPPLMPSVSKRQTVNPNESITLEAQININDIDPRGRRNIQAIVLIGPFINAMRRSLVIV